ncbi:MAG: AraC family transcriptional regulator [Chloroflexi bacterium OHK40]
MPSMRGSQASTGAQWAQLIREELVERLMRALPTDGAIEPLDGLRVRRESAPTGLGHGVSEPCFCVIAQGSKEVLLGTNRYSYDPLHYLIATATLPIASRVTEASAEQPYVSVILKLTPALVGSVMVEAAQPAPRGATAVTAIDVSALDVGLLDAVVRLVRLLDSPGDARFLAPMVKREIVYRLLRSEQGGRLAQIAAMGGAAHRITEAIERFRTAYNQPLRVEEVARALGMSVSGFHHHFRALTAMSPLQFQKHLRLQEARRLMLSEGLDAASAGYRVGYANPSHFTREYKRLFGAPPRHDVEQLRGRVRTNVGI